ncbi:NAD(P)H-dependent flavin oxidoreductase [Paraburkholderia rhynchosiae]|uniref:2-nitropropane dioxygenase n=1 Tax=Paraburkholderia rhynchosiae TaxID=487049 RepID=A0A2N7VX90_9BURK|nr:nitronate monooxygenase [Paraburkholderia rhynchosiae]PMS21772.1 2-nitropropane dioxygenase [Paraburkholderia rhynchosiae]CAB3739141.1 NADH:quinone reductase [Paraburkholderia rhynchosiae]
MRSQLFKTRITDLLGIRHPILCGGLGPRVSDADYVAAVVNAGGMGFIVAAGFADPDEFHAQLKRCRQLTQGQPFGVNLYISRQSGGLARVAEQIRILIEEGVSCVETAGASPQPVVGALREAGIKILHKVPAVKYAHSAARLGVDSIIMVGNDCGGHPGLFGISSMVQAAHGPSVVDLPVVIGGGIGTGRQMAAVLAMGADGIIMGSRMMVAEELWIHESYKEKVVRGDGTESVVVKRAIGDHHRVLLNDSARAVLALDDAKITDFEQFRPHVMGALAHEAYLTGDTSVGMLDYGPAVVFADAVKSVEAIFDDMIDDAAIAIRRLNGLETRNNQSDAALHNAAS